MFRSILLSLAGVFVGVPIIVAGASVTSSLIDGQSVPEALQTLAGGVDGLMGRVDEVEQAQVELVTSAVAIEANVSDLKTQNEDLQKKVTQLENRPPVIVEKTVTTIVEKQPVIQQITVSAPEPLAKANIPEQLTVSIRNKPQYDNIGHSLQNVQIFSVHLQATGDAPIVVTGFNVILKGDAPRAMIREINVLTGGDGFLGSDLGASSGGIATSYTIPAGEGRDVVLAVDMGDDIADFGPRQIGLTLNGVTTNNAEVFASFPLESLLYHASSTKK